MTISHIGIYAEPAKLEETIQWYLTVLKPIGYKVHMDLRPQYQVVGIGDSVPDLWIGSDETYVPNEKLHFAFCVKDRQKVREFHTAAMKLGAKCNGKPGPRPEYTRTYYAAFVYDPAGRNIEVMCILPEFMSEAKPRNLIIGTSVAAAAVGLGYFTGVNEYLSQLL